MTPLVSWRMFFVCNNECREWKLEFRPKTIKDVWFWAVTKDRRRNENGSKRAKDDRL
jgi:hypothetical protein